MNIPLISNERRVYFKRDGTFVIEPRPNCPQPDGSVPLSLRVKRPANKSVNTMSHKNPNTLNKCCTTNPKCFEWRNSIIVKTFDPPYRREHIICIDSKIDEASANALITWAHMRNIDADNPNDPTHYTTNWGLLKEVWKPRQTFV